MKKKLAFRLLAAFLIAALATAAAGLGLLDNLDATLSDFVYQHPEGTDGEIVVIGMDQRATEEYGPMPWPRDIMADVISILNSDPENAPAVIGVDVLYVGESSDPGADGYLAGVCAEGGNVVVASAAQFGSEVVELGENEFYMKTGAVIGWDEPYPDLSDVTDTGHINAKADNDGIIRHAQLYIDVPERGRVYSFARVIYEKYCEYLGEEPNPAPESESYYLSFSALPRAYSESVSVVDIIDGTRDPSEFAGKIVLIGPYAAGMMDEYKTAVSHAKNMYGVEIQANAIDAFRKGFFPKNASQALQLAALFILTFSAVLYFSDRKVLPSLIAWALSVAIWLGLCLLLFRGGTILNVLWVPLFITLIFIGSVAANYIRAAREKRKITNTFGHYIDPEIMRRLIAQGASALELGGKQYDIAVLFVDIRGFTTMSEALDPPTVVEIINKYLTLTTECIMKNHGTLDKFVGDCTMAFWNAPVEQEDPVYLACRAAMDMVEGSKKLGEELSSRFGRTVSFGVGVNWGPAVVGNIGAPKRMDYTAIGDTVNTAARLEANAPGGKIFISRAVADILGDRAVVTSLGDSIKLKGKAEGFEILTLDRLK
ncbi:MAG: adenylate/guanylate cyclase domain-containing protein [Oscillospiraceae bacterium]|nr:adenylate/guanylate cyclase domain-containing protein [Oscillospiraceae bacterium]